MFPVTTGAAQVTFGGISDGFAVALDTNGRSALYATLLGGADVDEVRGIAVDAAGALYVTGSTASSTFPTTGGAFQTTLTGPSDAFVLKIGLNGSSLNYSTLLGGTGLESGIAVNVTGDGLALVTGNTSSANFPTVAGSLQQSLSGDQDLFVVELNALATAPMYSSYLGGTADDSVMDAEHIDGLTLYLAGSTMSTDFPTTTGAASTLHAGASDAFVSRFDIVQLLAPNGRNALCAGDSHLISWTGSDLVNYDLAISANNGLTWTPLALGVNGTSYMWAPSASLPAGTAYRIRVRVAGGTEFDASDTAFTVLAPPRVLQHPTNFTRAEGASVTFTAAGTGSAPIGTVWQRSTDRGMTWTDIEGANADQYTTPAFAATDDSVQFRALYFNDCDTAATRAATVVVQAVRIVSPAGGEVFCLGTTQTISFTRQHVETVNIEISTNGGAGWNLLQAGVTGNSFDWTIPTGLRPGSDFRLRVVHAGGPASDAMDASFSIHSAPRVTIDPTDVTAPAGSAASFSVVGDAFPGYAIQWQSMAAGATEWTDIPNGNVAGLLLTGLTAEQNGTRVRAILSNACGADTSATATLTIGGVGSVESGVDASISYSLRPNPARDETNVTFVVRRAGDLRMTLVDARGEVVRTILERPVEPGSEDVRVDTRDLAAGRYRIVLALDEASVSLALTIVR
jgi:hypothetical protein